MNLYLIYIFNILIIALPLAIFEIFIEKNHGWGSGWKKDGWYAKPFLPNSFIVKFIAKLFRLEQPLNYHFLVFVVIVPFVFILEYYYLTYNALFFLAIFVGVWVTEDILWFLLNWYFDSRTQLLKGPNGSIWWHKHWIKISKNYYLPTCYFLAFLLSILIFIVAKSDTYSNISQRITTETIKSWTYLKNELS
jgi:hypothetical protein